MCISNKALKNRLYRGTHATTNVFNKKFLSLGLHCVKYVFVYIFLQVTYCVNGFVDKNNDLLYRDLSQCLYACGHPLAKTLYPEGKSMEETL